MNVWRNYRMVRDSAQDVLGDAFNKALSLVGIDDEERGRLKYQMASLPYVRDLMAYSDNMSWMDDYTKNTGIGYGDIKYPTRVGDSGLGAIVRDGYNYVSKNVHRLYE